MVEFAKDLNDIEILNRMRRLAETKEVKEFFDLKDTLFERKKKRILSKLLIN